MKKIAVLIFILFGMSVLAYEVYDNIDKSAVGKMKNVPIDKLDYDNYLDDPSESVYESEQEQYVYKNYGSTESGEYLNRGDAANYNGGSDFDRNYE
jgi:hypothetical protein